MMHRFRELIELLGDEESQVGRYGASALSNIKDFS